MLLDSLREYIECHGKWFPYILEYISKLSNMYKNSEKKMLDCSSVAQSVWIKPILDFRFAETKLLFVIKEFELLWYLKYIIESFIRSKSKHLWLTVYFIYVLKAR